MDNLLTLNNQRQQSHLLSRFVVNVPVKCRQVTHAAVLW
jgi:hypothetical protein